MSKRGPNLKTLEQFIEKWGELEGPKKFRMWENRQKSKLTRVTYDGPLIKCEGCGKEFKRMTPTHLKYSCDVS